MAASNVRYGLKDQPHGLFGDGFGVRATDLEAGIITGTLIPQAGVYPDQLGASVINKTGSTITAGSLVYISGYDVTASLQKITKAAATSQGTQARYVVLADITNNATGTVGKHYRLTGQNTNAATVDDPVYLNTTAGGYTLTSPPATGLVYQTVGRVVVKSATVGIIDFDVSFLQCVIVDRVQMAFPTIATTGASESLVIDAVRAGTIIGLRLKLNQGLALDGTNYITFTATNRTQSKTLTNAVVANSTFTGGQAITAYASYALTVTATAGDLIVASGDAITFTATVTGTLSSALTGSCSYIYTPN